MGRCLIVANQTLGGEELGRSVRDRIERGDRRFYIVVPMTAPEHETGAWTRGFSVGEAPTGGDLAQARKAVEEDARRREAALAEARRRAQRRLDQMTEKIESAGGEADGTVGDPDPVVAVKDALEDEAFDEVIVSTLPTGISRWLKMDLPSRVSRMAKVPVTTIEAEG